MTLAHGFYVSLILAMPIACAAFSEWRSINKAMDRLFDLPDDAYIHTKGGQANTLSENIGMRSCRVIALKGSRFDVGNGFAANDGHGSYVTRLRKRAEPHPTLRLLPAETAARAKRFRHPK